MESMLGLQSAQQATGTLMCTAAAHLDVCWCGFQVVKEVLRFRPPAPMVPQVAMRPFQLTPEYTAPKGAFIIPDIVSACHQGYSNPESFDPDRFR
jgi:hypothetical protein